MNFDYVSDLHLNFYIGNEKPFSNVQDLVKTTIAPKVKSEVIVIAGDINESVDRLSEFLYCLSKYYKQIIFIAGNHEYYIPYIKYIMGKEEAEKYNYVSLNKIEEINNNFKDNKNITFLDRSNGGICTYNGFKIAGDTLWYRPSSLVDWLYYSGQNDKNFILSDLSNREKILKMNEDSISWYNGLPNDLDLIVTHVPPIKNRENGKGNNCCYYTNVDIFKSKIWIYGHDHKENDYEQDGTRFISNPWGYNNRDYKIKTLTIKK